MRLSRTKSSFSVADAHDAIRSPDSNLSVPKPSWTSLLEVFQETPDVGRRHLYQISSGQLPGELIAPIRQLNYCRALRVPSWRGRDVYGEVSPVLALVMIRADPKGQSAITGMLGNKLEAAFI